MTVLALARASWMRVMLGHPNYFRADSNIETEPDSATRSIVSMKFRLTARKREGLYAIASSVLHAGGGLVSLMKRALLGL